MAAGAQKKPNLCIVRAGDEPHDERGALLAGSNRLGRKAFDWDVPQPQARVRPKRTASSRQVDAWLRELTDEELKTVDGCTFRIGRDFLVALASSLIGCPPPPSVRMDEVFYISWQLDDVTISLEVDDEGDVEWWCCSLVEDGRASVDRDVVRGTFSGLQTSLRADSTERDRAMAEISEALRGND